MIIGGVLLELSATYHAKIYLAGEYDVDWDNAIENETIPDLKYKVSFHKYRDENITHITSIYVEKTLNGKKSLRLTETKQYVIKLEGTDKPNIDVIKFQNEKISKFFKRVDDVDSTVFQFVNYLGKTELHLGKNYQPLPFEIIPDKFDYENDYITLTEAIADVCSELLLEYSGSTSNVFSSSTKNNECLLEQFIFLRKFCYRENIRGLFESIVRNPDRILVQNEVLKPLGTGIPATNFYRNPFKQNKGWMPIHDNNRQSVYYAPQFIPVSNKSETLDTPANRFIKFALQSFDSICSDLIRALNKESDNKQSECLAEAISLHNELNDILRDAFFDDIGEMQIIPQNNQVLQKRNGYSQVFLAYAMLDLALKLNWSGKDDIYEGESKNVALLYEYWLFFELYKIVKNIDDQSIIDKNDSSIVFNDGIINIYLKQGEESCTSFELPSYDIKINLYYNKTFSPKKYTNTSYEGSYSRCFRPDFTLAIFPSSFSGNHNGEDTAILFGSVKYLHFDAKYRITELTDIIGSKFDTEKTKKELDEEKRSSIVNTYKRGDLLKMHTYNDAIRRTIGSYVLYPGNGSEKKDEQDTFSLYDEILPGVGAFAIKPSINKQGENELKNFILKVIKSIEKNYSRLNRLAYYNNLILSEPQLSTFDDVDQNQQAERIQNYAEKLLNISKKQKSTATENAIPNQKFIIGYIRNDSNYEYYDFLSSNGFLSVGRAFPFYFYAIKGDSVYSHHKDVFKTTYFRFYKNNVQTTNSYILEPVLCRIISSELISKRELVKRLNSIHFETDETNHFADFYYVLNVTIESVDYTYEELSIQEVNQQNSNNTLPPLSPKIIG